MPAGGGILPLLGVIFGTRFGAASFGRVMGLVGVIMMFGGGLALAAGADVEGAQREIQQVVEGVRVAREVDRIADQMGVEMPIARQAYRVLHEGVAPRDAVRRLTDRPFRAEKD